MPSAWARVSTPIFSCRERCVNASTIRSPNDRKAAAADASRLRSASASMFEKGILPSRTSLVVASHRCCRSASGRQRPELPPTPRIRVPPLPMEACAILAPRRILPLRDLRWRLHRQPRMAAPEDSSSSRCFASAYLNVCSLSTGPTSACASRWAQYVLTSLSPGGARSLFVFFSASLHLPSGAPDGLLYKIPVVRAGFTARETASRSRVAPSSGTSVSSNRRSTTPRELGPERQQKPCSTKNCVEARVAV